MKRWFAIPVIFVVLILALLIGPSFVDWNKYKGQAQEQLATLAGLDLKINGDISLGLLPTPRVYIENVVVSDPTDTAQALAALDQLDVKVALAPLIMGGNVVIDSFKLKNPSVRLVKDAQGRFNYMTPELEALMAKDPGEETPAEEKSKVSVSFKNAEIENGTFYYADAASEAPIEIRALDLDVSADSLDGPFEAEGSLQYAGKPVSFDLKTGAIDPALKATTINLEAEAFGANLSYAGTAALGDAPEVQGELEVAIKSLKSLMEQNAMAAPPEIISGEIALKGLVTANAEGAALRDGEIKLANQSFKGQADVGLNPLSLTGRFVADQALNLDQFTNANKKKSDGKTDAPIDPASLSQALPQTLELPVIGALNLEFVLPGIVVAKQEVKNVTLQLNKKDNSFQASVTAAQVPGAATVQASGSLGFSEKRMNEAGDKEIYSGPSLSFAVKGQAENFSETVEALTQQKNIPVISSARKAVFDISGGLKTNAFLIDKGVVNLDDKAFSISGGLTKPKDASRSVLDVKILADRFNFDTLTNGSKSENASSQKTSDPLAPLKTLSLPYDVKMDLVVNDATAQGYAVEGLRAKASVLNNAIVIDDLGADNFAGSSMRVNGRIGALNTLSDIQLSATLNSPDPYKLAEALKINHATWPKNLGTVKANIKASGTIESLDTNATLGALGGDVIFKGVVSRPLSAPQLSNVALQVKHPNMAQGAKNLGYALPQYQSFNGPMDVFANVDMGEKVTSLTGIQAKMAGTNFTGNIKYDASGAVPNVNGDLKFGELILQSAGSAAASRRDTAPSQSAANSGKWSSAPINVDFLRSMNADFTVTGERLLYETWDMKSPELKIALQNGTMSINSLRAGLFDGNIAMTGALISSAKDKPLSLRADTKITGINMGALAKALSGSGRIQAEGDVSLNFDVSSTGLSQRDLVQGLTGKADLKGNNVIMKGFDLAGLGAALMDSAKPLDRLQQIVGSTTSGGQTAFDTITGAYTISNGIVNIGSMQMDGPSAQIASKGSADLPRWYIDTVHTVTLKNAPDVAPFDINIKGSLDNPGNTFGKGMFDTILRNKLQGKILEKAPDLLGDDVTNKLQQFGILPTQKQAQPVAEPTADSAAPDASNTVPSEQQTAPANDNTQAAPAPTREQQQQEAIKGLLNNFLR